MHCPQVGGANSALNNVYSLSTQIQRECKQMYEQLEATQRSTMDVNSWLDRFLPCLLRALQGADDLLAGVLDKTQFCNAGRALP